MKKNLFVSSWWKFRKESMEKKKVEDMSFEEAFAKLNKILEEFENGEVSLETSISLYEEGMLLKNHCDKKLQNAEMKIKKVVGKKSEDGE